MTTLTALEIATFAEKFDVPISAAHTLPAIFEKIAKIGKSSVRTIVFAASFDPNPELGNYVRYEAIKLAKIVPAK